MSIKFSNTCLWEHSPMIAFVDPRWVILNKKARRELMIGVGKYIHEIEDHYFWLIVDYKDPSTFILALQNWMRDYPQHNSIHMNKMAKCQINELDSVITYDLSSTLKSCIPSDKEIIFHIS